MTATVTVFQYRLFHYRIPLFERMRDLAAGRGIDLHVVCGQPSPNERAKQDVGRLPWAERVRNWYLPIKDKKDLCWQPTPRHLRDSELVILMQENRLLSNYLWMLRHRLRRAGLLAFWGHGRDFHAGSGNTLRERWKRACLDQVDWWFAYTSRTVEVLHEAGFPAARTTCLNNAIDTRGLRRDAAEVPPEMLAALRRECGLPPEGGGPVGLFCGSIYPDKLPGLLVEACDLIHTRIPEFRLVVVGDGPSAPELQRAFRSRPWARWVGAKRGRQKAACFKLATVVLNPGLVGLHVLDAFAMGLPLVTTRCGIHSPEIAYLEHGVNGLVAERDPGAFAAAAVQLFSDRALYARLAAAAYEAGSQHTVEGMAERFVAGIERCLAWCGCRRATGGES